MLLAAGVVFFFAFNWEALGRASKFALVQGLLAASVLVAWRLGPERAGGQAALVGAALLTGALLALVGQTYQTGADPWQLFALWVLLILPWACVARSSGLWLLAALLANLATVLWFQALDGVLGLLFGRPRTLWMLFGLDTALLVAWEFAMTGRCPWLARWGARTLATLAGTAATMLALWSLFEGREAGPYGLPAWLAFMAAGFVWYRHRRIDVFMLSAGVLGAVVVTVTLFGKYVFGTGGFSFLMLGFVVIGLSAAGAWWIRQVAREVEQ